MNLTHHRQTLRLKYAFNTATGGVSQKETIVVRVEDDGVVGLGECAPSKLYGQSLEKSEEMLDAVQPLLGDDPFAIEAILSRLIEHHDDQRAAIAGVETALHDWVGKRLGVPVWRLLGLPRPRVATTYTIGLAPLDEIRKKLDEFLEMQGRQVGNLSRTAPVENRCHSLKVKVGGEQDEETLALIRERFDGPLLLDANEAWTPATAGAHIRRLARFKPVMIEQPVPKDDWPALAELRKLGVAPIFADESCERPADVVKLFDAGAVDGVNVKFTKCGGIREAMRMIALARALRLQVMLGCFVSSSLAIAPAVAIGCLADWCDLDGALLLANDPFTGIGFDGTWLTLVDSPGVGVRAKGSQ